MNGWARAIVEMLCSRNNDISGYWGVGMLCAIATTKSLWKFSFKIVPDKIIKIYGCEITGSAKFTEKLCGLGIDSIEGRLSFFPDGRYASDKDKYTCGIAISVTQSGRTGLYMSYVECWQHDPSVENRSGRYLVTDL